MIYRYLFLLLVFPVTLFAQSNYHQGYILKNNGDTLKGFINYREWSTSPRSIDFKINIADKQSLSFTPQGISEFEIRGGDTYITYKGVISMDKNNFPDISDRLDTTKKTDTIFLRQVTTGKNIALYTNTDDIKTRFFISEIGDKPFELIYHEYYSEVNGHTGDVSSSAFKGQLVFYANKYAPDNSHLIASLQTIRFKEFELEAFINKLNNNFIANKASNIRFFAGLGASLTNTNVSGVHTATISPRVNLGIDIFTNPKVQRLIFRAEFSLSYIAPRLNNFTTSSGISSDDTYSFDQYTAAITPQLIVNVYNTDKLKFYLSAGIGLNLSAYSNSKLVAHNGSILQTIDKPYALASCWANFPLQAGIVLNKKAEIFFTYTGSDAYTQYSSFRANNQSISLGAKFLFN